MELRINRVLINRVRPVIPEIVLKKLNIYIFGLMILSSVFKICQNVGISRGVTESRVWAGPGRS